MALPVVAGRCRWPNDLDDDGNDDPDDDGDRTRCRSVGDEVLRLAHVKYQCTAAAVGRWRWRWRCRSKMPATEPMPEPKSTLKVRNAAHDGAESGAQAAGCREDAGGEVLRLVHVTSQCTAAASAS